MGADALFTILRVMNYVHPAVKTLRDRAEWYKLRH